MSNTNQTVEIDNISYHSTLSGPQDTPVILLTHALMSNSHMWDPIRPTLHNQHYRTLTFDHIGHNQTPFPQTPPMEYTTETIVAHMHEIVRQVTGQDRLKAVMGCSIGGVLALRYGMLYPSLTGAVISLCAPGITSLEHAKPLWSQRIQQFESDLQTNSSTLCDATVARWLPGETDWDAQVRSQALEHVRTCSIEGYRILADAIRNYDYARELGKLEGVRCLVIAGGRDGAVDAELLRGVAKEIPGARFELMREAGHIPPMHRPAEFQKLVVEFLGGG